MASMPVLFKGRHDGRAADNRFAPLSALCRACCSGPVPLRLTAEAVAGDVRLLESVTELEDANVSETRDGPATACRHALGNPLRRSDALRAFGAGGARLQ